MKTIKILFLTAILVALCNIDAHSAEVKYVDANTLNLIGRISPTAKAYARVDTAIYNDLTAYQKNLVTDSPGMALTFKTNSSQIKIKSFFKWYASTYNQTGINVYGYDLYIKKNGEWLYAYSNSPKSSGKEFTLIEDMDDSEKECLLYLPSFCHVDSISVGVDAGAKIEAMPNPFRHRVLVFGSSYTHGTSANRSGMSYPMIMERDLGIYIMSLGVSGNSKLQQTFARVIADTPVDALIFDTFSNPSAQEIEERFEPFLKTVRAAHPNVPMIFLQTLYREGRNFNQKVDAHEKAKMEAAERVVRNAMKTDKNIYFLNYENITGDNHATSTDGVHPSALGYYHMAKTWGPQIKKILGKYGIE